MPYSDVEKLKTDKTFLLMDVDSLKKVDGVFWCVLEKFVKPKWILEQCV